MAWTPPMTFVTGAAVTAAQLNTHLTANLNETVPAKATTAGSYFVGTGPNSIAERQVSHSFVGASESTGLTSPADLDTGGPFFPATTGTKALLSLSATVSNNTVGAASLMSVDISGATTIAPVSAVALRFISAVANQHVQASYLTLSSLNAGSNYFVAKYSVGSGTGTWSNRRMILMPL